MIVTFQKSMEKVVTKNAVTAPNMLAIICFKPEFINCPGIFWGLSQTENCLDQAYLRSRRTDAGCICSEYSKGSSRHRTPFIKSQLLAK